MNCFEIQERVCDAIDNRLQNDELNAFSTHVHRCPPCRHEYQELNVAKRILQKKLRHVSVPETVYSSIVQIALSGVSGSLRA